MWKRTTTWLLPTVAQEGVPAFTVTQPEEGLAVLKKVAEERKVVIVHHVILNLLKKIRLPLFLSLPKYPAYMILN
jgi:hypothetical protein